MLDLKKLTEDEMIASMISIALEKYEPDDEADEITEEDIKFTISVIEKELVGRHAQA